MAESLSDCSMDLESAEEEIEIESEGAENAKSTPNAEHNEHWNEEIALNFKEYLMSGRYPPRRKGEILGSGQMILKLWMESCSIRNLEVCDWHSIGMMIGCVHLRYD